MLKQTDICAASVAEDVIYVDKTFLTETDGPLNKCMTSHRPQTDLLLLLQEPFYIVQIVYYVLSPLM